ncbi:MAG: protein kinase [Gammaproteobacteria bacterium]
MRILIIDDSRDFISLLRLYLNKELQDAEIIDYDFLKNGKPNADFDWSGYDVLLLDYKLGEHEDGLAWLKEFSRNPMFPPTIVLTAEGDEYIAVKAIKLGASDYINKKDISPKRLAEMVTAALEINAEKTAEKKLLLEQDSNIVRELRETAKKAPDSKKNKISTKEDYKLVRLIGQGAMSHVYLAERVTDGLSVVLKVLDISGVTDRVLLRRFVQEAILISEIRSPFVVKIYEHGVTQKYGFIALEFFSRGDLKQRIEYGIHPEVAVSYMTHIAYGLMAIHELDIIHRDLKPANIMFRGDDSLALADFGISKRLGNRSDFTTLGKVLGTPHYMSPEQGQGLTIDARSDIYSAGIIFYELLTAKKPFRADSPAALIYQHIHADVPQLAPALSRYQAIVSRCLAKEPEQRYTEASELITDLEALE